MGEEASSVFGRQDYDSALDSLVAQRFTGKESLSVFGRQDGYDGALDSLVAQGFMGEEASSMFGRQGYDGALDSLVAQRFTGEEAPSEKGHRACQGAVNNLINEGVDSRSALSELGICGAADRRKSSTCKYTGCTRAMHSGDFCKHHRPIKAEKSDRCKSCRQVLGVEVKVMGGVCKLCYRMPEATTACKKAMPEKKAAQGECSTPGCKCTRFNGRDICQTCYMRSHM